GAAANVNPVSGIGAGGEEQYDDLARIGAMLGGEVVKTWAQVRTHNRRGPRRIVQSVATVSVWGYEPVPDESVNYFGVASPRLTRRRAPLPAAEAAERQLAAFRQARDALPADASPGRRQVAQRNCTWAELVARTATEQRGRITRDLDLWAMRINDIGIVAVS